VTFLSAFAGSSPWCNRPAVIKLDNAQLARALRRAEAAHASTRSGQVSVMRTGPTGTPITSFGSRPADRCRHEQRPRRHRHRRRCAGRGSLPTDGDLNREILQRLKGEITDGPAHQDVGRSRGGNRARHERLRQSAKEIRGATPYAAIENEPAPKLIVDPPIPEALAQGTSKAIAICEACSRSVRWR
jgi:hypothetical protein